MLYVKLCSNRRLQILSFLYLLIAQIFANYFLCVPKTCCCPVYIYIYIYIKVQHGPTLQSFDNRSQDGAAGPTATGAASGGLGWRHWPGAEGPR